MMNKEARTAWFEALPAGIRRKIDGYVLQDQSFAAIGLVSDVGLVRFGIGLGTAQLIVGDRYQYYGDRIAHRPDDPLDLESLAFLADGFGERIVAIEAVWDGDTLHDWFVRLQAILEEPGKERTMAMIYWKTAERYLGDAEEHGLRHLSAVAAERAGQPLAEHLGVPFHFASPDEPDDDAPRWRA